MNLHLERAVFQHRLDGSIDDVCVCPLEVRHVDFQLAWLLPEVGIGLHAIGSLCLANELVNEVAYAVRVFFICPTLVLSEKCDGGPGVPVPRDKHTASRFRANAPLS